MTHADLAHDREEVPALQVECEAARGRSRGTVPAGVSLSGSEA